MSYSRNAFWLNTKLKCLGIYQFLERYAYEELAFTCRLNTTLIKAFALLLLLFFCIPVTFVVLKIYIFAINFPVKQDMCFSVWVFNVMTQCWNIDWQAAKRNLEICLNNFQFVFRRSLGLCFSKMLFSLFTNIMGLALHVIEVIPCLYQRGRK